MDDRTLRPFLDLAVDRNVLLIAAAIFVALRALQRSEVGRATLYRRLLPFLPESMGVAAVLLGGVPAVVAFPVVAKIAIGLWAGYLAQKFKKLLGQTVLGDDRHIEARARVEEPAPRGGNEDE